MHTIPQTLRQNLPELLLRQFFIWTIFAWGLLNCLVAAARNSIIWLDRTIFFARLNCLSWGGFGSLIILGHWKAATLIINWRSHNIHIIIFGKLNWFPRASFGSRILLGCSKPATFISNRWDYKSHIIIFGKLYWLPQVSFGSWILFGCWKAATLIINRQDYMLPVSCST